MNDRILLDTQALVWIRMDHPALSKRARKAYASQSNEIFVSIVSIWEIAIKKSLGKIQLPGTLEDFVTSAIEVMGVTILPIRVEHILKLEDLPFHHRDPFDRILIAQALQEKMNVLGNDPSFDDYRVKRIW